MNGIYINFLQAAIAILFLLLVDFVMEFLLIKKITDKKKSLKARVLLRYILFFCFFFFMAKIWVDGFGYLLSFVGIIAAALTITQKEYLMNFCGWLVIMWRDLFVEGDYIEVGKYTGYVQQIGLLYFSLEETSDMIWGDKTGRVIKVPNSLVANNPIINFTADNTFLESKLSFIFTFESSLEKIQSLAHQLEHEIEKVLHARKKHWSLEKKETFEQLKKAVKPQALLRVFQDKPSGIQLRIRYTSFKSDQKEIENKAFEIVMEMVNANEDLVLTIMI